MNCVLSLGMTDFSAVARVLRTCYGWRAGADPRGWERSTPGYPVRVTNSVAGETPDEEYPGSALGLPADGAGALATWGQRVTALVVDWAVAMLLAVLVTWGGVLSSTGPAKFATLVIFFLEKALLTGLTGSSLGQRLVGIGVTRTDGRPIPFGVAIVRTLMICVVIPAVVIGTDRRSLNDMLLRTVVVKRR